MSDTLFLFMIVSKELDAKLSKVNNKNKYTIKEGDRIFVSDYCKIKKRDVDKFLSTKFQDVKRVSKLEKASVAYDNYDYNRFTMLKARNYHVMLINGKKVETTWYYDKVEEFYQSCIKILSSNDLDKGIKASKDYYGRMRYDLNTTWFYDNRPDLFKLEYKINDSLDYTNLFKDLDNIPIYDYIQLYELMESTLNDTVRESLVKEDIDFESIRCLLTSSDKNNIELGLTMLANFNIRDVLTEMVCTVFETHCNLDIKNMLKRDPIFKKYHFPSAGNRGSYLNDTGFSHFKECINMLKKNNIPVNYDYIIKFLFDVK